MQIYRCDICGKDCTPYNNLSIYKVEPVEGFVNTGDLDNDVHVCHVCLQEMIREGRDRNWRIGNNAKSTV